ncbi:hypothetical protein [Glutamicibacter soli]|uniref:hypothetical protein n=1 Tax=Glutamicibacter soli TaxID=453836 RepID=UPI003FD1C2C3
MSGLNEHLELATLRIRDTAKWLIISLAAVGGVFVAGIQLSDIGLLELWSPRFWGAILGIAFAAIGGGIALWGAVLTLASDHVYLNHVTDQDLVPRAAKNATAHKTGGGDATEEVPHIQGFKNVEELRNKYHEVLDKRRELLRQNSGLDKESNKTEGENPTSGKQGQPEPDDQDFDLVDNYAVYLDGIVRNVLAVANLSRARHVWRISVTMIASGAVVASFGIALFAYASNPPAPSAGSVVNTSNVVTPLSAKLQLSEQGRQALGDALGSNCDLNADLTIVVLGQTEAGPDVLANSPKCNPVRLILDADWGIIKTTVSKTP